MAIDEARLEEFLHRFVGDLGATVHAANVVIGDQLGLYKGLAAAGPSSPAELAEHLIAAHRTARRLDARPLTERVTETLAALGERPERRLGRRAVAQAANGNLTRREGEVVRLVARGHTNREIPRELYLSPRTVEMHVGSVLLKLDCRSRADAARRASELGLLAGVT
jgi:DNA-binding NarL/FixJ family response regulator